MAWRIRSSLFLCVRQATATARLRNPLKLQGMPKQLAPGSRAKSEGGSPVSNSATPKVMDRPKSLPPKKDGAFPEGAPAPARPSLAQSGRGKAATPIAPSSAPAPAASGSRPAPSISGFADPRTKSSVQILGKFLSDAMKERKAREPYPWGDTLGQSEIEHGALTLEERSRRV